MGMAPSEFWRLTYAELRLVLEGCNDRRRRELKFRRKMDAWLAAVIVQPHVKERITPAMLTGEDSPEKQKGRVLEAFDKAAKSKKLMRKTPDSQNLFKRGSNV